VPAQIRVEQDRGAATIYNDLPLPVAVLFRVFTDSVTSRLEFARVEAQASLPLRDAATKVVLELVEPLSPRVPLAVRPRAACGTATEERLRETIAQLEREAAVAPQEHSEAAAASIAAATQLAQLRLERTRDSLHMVRHSAVALVARVQSTSSMSASELARRVDRDREEQRNETIEDLGYAALAYAEAASRSTTSCRAMLPGTARCSTAARALSNACASASPRSDAEERVRSQYQELAAGALTALTEPVALSAVSRGATVSRACPDPPQWSIRWSSPVSRWRCSRARRRGAVRRRRAAAPRPAAPDRN
jgi:hypothetical protein